MKDTHDLSYLDEGFLFKLDHRLRNAPGRAVLLMRVLYGIPGCHQDILHIAQFLMWFFSSHIGLLVHSHQEGEWYVRHI